MDFPAVVERSSLRQHHPDTDPDELSFVIRVQPSLTATAVVVNYPGFNGSYDGHGGKYRRLAEELGGAGLTVVRMENKPTLALDYESQVVADLKDTVAWIRVHAHEICFDPDPDLYLVGTSMGAAACAAAATELGAKKLLLFAPAPRLEEEISRTLPFFSGQIFVAVGSRDEVTGVEVVDWLREQAPAAQFRSCLLEGCDHHFSGQEQHYWEIPLEVLVEDPKPPLRELHAPEQA